MVLNVKVETRESSTRAQLKELRTEGKIPAVVYGRKIGSELISIDEKQLLSLLRDHPNAIIDMEIPAVGVEKVMIEAVQRDSLHRGLLHVDFRQINMDQQVRASVRLEFAGTAAGVRAGGILQIQKNELEVRCLPTQIPESITVDITTLEQGDVMTVSEIRMPEGIQVSDHMDEVVVSILTPRIAVEVSAEGEQAVTVGSAEEVTAGKE